MREIYGNCLIMLKFQDSGLMLILLLVLVASGADLIADLRSGVRSAHIVQEAGVFTAVFCGIGWLLARSRRQGREIRRLEQELREVGTLPRPDDPGAVIARQGLAREIARQFDAWGLTRSEMEIGQFLLKGLSLKEIAALRGTAEKTIRQQSSSIYHKSGLSGRHAFAAWFIEDIL